MSRQQCCWAVKSSSESMHSLKGGIVMLKAIYILLAVLALLAFSVPASATPAAQTGCSWFSDKTLERPGNEYTDGPMTSSVHYIPPHFRNGGDRDFSSNGPIVHYSIDPFMSSAGIGVQLSMRAKETKSDWTTVNGASGDLWFLRLLPSWQLRRVGRFEVIDGRSFIIPGSVFAIPQDREWGPPTEVEYIDDNHDVEVTQYQGTFANLASFRHIDWKHEVVGDTKGDEAGTETGIRVYTWINAYELCPG